MLLQENTVIARQSRVVAWQMPVLLQDSESCYCKLECCIVARQRTVLLQGRELCCCCRIKERKQCQQKEAAGGSDAAGKCVSEVSLIIWRCVSLIPREMKRCAEVHCRLGGG